MSDEESSSGLSATIPVVPILVPMGVHFLLVCFVLLSVSDPPPTSYMFSHLFFFFVGLWAVRDRKSVLAVVVFLVVVAMTILLDIIVLGVFFGPAEYDNGGGDDRYERLWQFSAGMGIINLVLKPLTIVLAVLTIFIRYKGTEAITSLFRGGNRNKQGYSSLDGQP